MPGERRQSTIWCERHWARVRDDTSYNGIYATLLLTQAFLDRPEVADEAGSGAGSTERLNAIMARHAPLCEFLGEDTLRAIYEGAKLPGGPSGLHGEARGRHDMADMLRRMREDREQRQPT